MKKSGRNETKKMLALLLLAAVLMLPALGWSQVIGSGEKSAVIVVAMDEGEEAVEEEEPSSEEEAVEEEEPADESMGDMDAESVDVEPAEE